ncbi:Pyruvate dehydrogenase complex component Pdx1 [Penicillium sp. DV-2018c]|nr:Pyruvate dehydrogenase complex component Pdx1 [Penicillium sp. DV-2018c]KAJ5566433.1 Pyruvate dehydrogenase complex component Pdx1 [Penicillium sp. DV-2018c]
MAAKITVGQIPAMFARRQQKVSSVIGRRLQSTSQTTQNPAYPLYPSVAQLLREKGIPQSDVPKIPASGPKGRLLKGDVLAYIGQIPADYPSAQAASLAKLAHLDLSNIKIAPASAPAAPAAVVEEKIVAPPPMSSVAVSVSLAAVLSAQKKIQDNLGVTIPLSRFLAIATELANDDLPRAPSYKPSADELFDEVLGAEPLRTSRGDYIPELNAVEVPKTVRSKPVTEDIIDFLSSKSYKKPLAAGPVESESDVASNVFSLTVPAEEEVRAKAFLERIKTLLSVEPARLVL